MYNNIVILTGAGISAESGIATFRDREGLWENHSVQDVATPEGYSRNPALVLDFYNYRRRELKSVQPNDAHYALADLEKKCGGNILLVTQNVDNLHERAGAEKLIHMHGELNKIRCVNCDKVFFHTDDIDLKTVCVNCGHVGTLRPHIVWFGEIPLNMDEITDALSRCDLFMSIGTSGNVYPAAGFVQYAKAAGAHTVELNLEKSVGASSFREQIYGKATEIVPKYVAKLLENRQ